MFHARQKLKTETHNDEDQSDEAVEIVEKETGQEAILEEWNRKLSDPDLDQKGRYKLLKEFGMDERIPVYDLVLHVTEHFREKDWFSVFFHRINKEEETNILECLRAYPLLYTPNLTATAVSGLQRGSNQRD